LRIVTYRLEGGRGVEMARRLAQEWHPDLLLLQSIDRDSARVFGEDPVAELAETLGMEFAWLPLNSEQGGASGLATLSRVPIQEIYSEKLDRIAPEQTQQGVLGVELDWGGRPLIIWNARLGSSDETGGELHAQTRQLARLADDRAHAAQIIGGSFGMDPKAAPLTVLRDRFQDAWTLRGGGLGYTTPSAEPRRREDFFWTTKREDYLVENILVFSAPGASDHLPVVIDLAPAPQRPPAPPPSEAPIPEDEPHPVERPSVIPGPDGRPVVPGITRPFAPSRSSPDADEPANQP
jgi:endonuclease/exonuclease/phosphatase family metal-dependent hydrolase